MIMVIDWSVTAVYNTIMSVAVGVALVLIVRFFDGLFKNKITQLDGWSIAFISLGFILTLTGGHMSLTWPLSKMGFAFDDIIFGETSLAFGILLIAFGIILLRRTKVYTNENLNFEEGNVISECLKKDLPAILRPLSLFAAAMGGALISIACAGIGFQLFAAPPEEPISGRFADYPMIEATFMSGLFAITGIGALLLPFMLKDKIHFNIFNKVKILFYIAGIIFILFGIMNYFTHIGLIVNTME